MVRRTTKLLLYGYVFALISGCAHVDTQVYFSPRGGCEAKVVELMTTATQSVDVAIYSLNNRAILEALNNAHKRAVKIRVLLDRVQASGNREETLALKKAGIDVRIHSKNKIQHNKVGIFDGRKILTGSFNWTFSAETANEENCLVTDDQRVVKAYITRFNDHLWAVNTAEKSEAAFTRLDDAMKDLAIKNPE